MGDVIQDTYVRLWRAKANDRLRNSCPRAFLFTAARNQAISLIRRRNRSPLVEASYEIACAVPEPDPDLRQRLTWRQELAALHEAIEALPPRRRAVLVLRKLDGVSHEEIAHRLGVSVHTAENQVGYALRSCAAYLHARVIHSATQAAL